MGGLPGGTVADRSLDVDGRNESNYRSLIVPQRSGEVCVPALTIFEEERAPAPTRQRMLTRLLVSAEMREEDNEAVEQLRILAKILGEAGFTDRTHVLSIVRVCDLSPKVTRELPCLVNGVVYKGVDSIRRFVLECKRGYEGRHQST